MKVKSNKNEQVFIEQVLIQHSSNPRSDAGMSSWLGRGCAAGAMKAKTQGVRRVREALSCGISVWQVHQLGLGV